MNVSRNLNKVQDRAIEGAKTPHRTEYQSETWKELLELFKKLGKAELVVEVYWIPSHEKKQEEWVEPRMWNNVSCRAINEKADVAAGAKRDEVLKREDVERKIEEDKKLDSITKKMLRHRSKGLGDYWDRICDSSDRERRLAYRKFRAADTGDPHPD